MSGMDLFILNYQLLICEDVRVMCDDVVVFLKFILLMCIFLLNFVDFDFLEQLKFVVFSVDFCFIDGVCLCNLCYLQVCLDIVKLCEIVIVNFVSYLYYGLLIDELLFLLVDVVVVGCCNNLFEGKILVLCVYNLLYYMELLELFMEFIFLMIGKSFLMMGVGLEGVLMKVLFNVLLVVFDFNLFFLFFVLLGYDGWLFLVGFIGLKVEVVYDIFLFVLEIFCWMFLVERDVKIFIEGGYLEKLEDYDKDGEFIFVFCLGYCMMEKFMCVYFGCIFLYFDIVFIFEMLCLEFQDVDIFVDLV